MKRIETWICFALAVVLILFSQIAHGDSYFRKAAVGIAPVVTVYESADTLYFDTDMTDFIFVGDEVKVVSMLDSLSFEIFTVTAITSAKADINSTWDHPTITDGRLELVGPQLTIFDDSKAVAFRVDKQPMLPLRSAFPDTTDYIGGELWMSTTGDSLYVYENDHTIEYFTRATSLGDMNTDAVDSLKIVDDSVSEADIHSVPKTRWNAAYVHSITDHDSSLVENLSGGDFVNPLRIPHPLFVTGLITQHDGSVPTWGHSPTGLAVEGTSEFDGIAYFDDRVIMFNDKDFSIGSGNDFVLAWDSNGTADAILRSFLAKASVDDSPVFWFAKDLNPDNMADHDDYLSPSFVWVNDEGADAGDYIGVVQGWRAQADVEAQTYYDFYSMVGAADGTLDATTTEIGAIIRIGNAGSATTDHGLTAGGVLLEDDVEIDGVVYADQGVIQGYSHVGSSRNTTSADYFIGVSSDDGAITITLDTDNVVAGRTFHITDEDGNAASNNITIDTEASETIDGVADYTISTNNAAISLYCNGTNWFITSVDFPSSNPDLAGIYIVSSAETAITTVNIFEQVTTFDADMPEDISNGDHNNNNITVGATGVYEVKFIADGEGAGANKVYEFYVFELAATSSAVAFVTAANPCVISSEGHGFSDGNRVKIEDVGGATGVNDRIYTVAASTDSTYALDADQGTDVDGTGFGVWDSDGTATLATILPQIHSERKFAVSSDVGSFSGGGLVSLTIGKTLELWVKGTNDDTNMTVDDCSFYIIRVQ